MEWNSAPWVCPRPHVRPGHVRRYGGSRRAGPEVAPFNGIYDSHVRDPVFHLIESDKEALEIGRRAGIGVKIAHEKAPGLMNHGRAVDIVALVNRARAEGLDAVVDQYPYDGASTGLFSNLFILPNARARRSRRDAHRAAAKGASRSCGTREGS